MKRKTLEKTEPAELMINTDSKFAVAAVVHDIKGASVLEIDIWGKKEINGTRKMMCRHFLDKEGQDYDTLFTSTQEFQRKTYHEGEWSKLRLITIFSRGDYYYSYYSERQQSMTDKTRAIIKTYMKCFGTQNVLSSIESEEYSIASDKNERAYHRKVDRIDEMMARVEPVGGEAFDTWLKTVVFPERYIFAETRKLKTGYRCRCAECGKTFMTKEKPKHNEWMSCKKCGTKAIIKTRVQQVTEERSVLVAQPYEGNTWVLRHFKFRKYSAHMMKKTSSSIAELEKVRMFMTLGQKIKIYYGTRDSYGNDEFAQDWWDKKSYGNNMVIDKNFYLYPGRIQEIEMPVELKRMLEAGARQGVELDYNTLIRGFRYKPYMEYLIKGRYYRLAQEVLKQYSCWSHADDLFDLGADNVADLLQIDVQRAYRLREMNGGIHALQCLQIEERDGIKISQENLIFADKYKLDGSCLELHRTHMQFNKAMNYIRRQMEKNHMSFTTVKQYYHDYLDMAEERGADLTDDIIRANSRMIEFHMTYLEEKNRKEDKNRLRKLQKKFPNIKKDYKQNSALMAWENQHFVILVPKGIMDILQEGRAQHHCVAASDTYFDRMNKRESFILFLRRKEQPELPYYTLEIAIKKGKVNVRQRYAAYDRQPDIKEVDKNLTEWKKVVEKRMKKLEMAAVQAG